MDEKIRQKVDNPRENASAFSIVTFRWIFKIFALGFKRELVETDLYTPLKEHSSEVLRNKIVNLWQREVRKQCEKRSSHPSLLRVLIKLFGKKVLLIGVALTVVEFGPRLVYPLVLAKLLQYLRTDKSEWDNQVYYYAAAFILLPFITCFVEQSTLQALLHIGMKIRVACSSLIYRKALKLSNTAFERGTSTGQVVNLLSNDVGRLDYSVFSLHYFWIGPLQTIVITCILFYIIGWPAFVGMATFLIFVPLQVFLGKKASKLTLLTARRSDERLRLMNGILNGIATIKMYAWEASFSDLVKKARRKEVQAVKKHAIIEEFSFTFDLYIPRLSLFLTLISYVISGNHIDAEKVFSITLFYDILKSSMTLGFPMSIFHTVEAMVSVKRLQEFLMHPEIEKPQVETSLPLLPQKTDTSERAPETSTVAVFLKNICASWSPDSTEKTLNDLSLSVESGSLVVVVGQIGTGKSSILQAILYELPIEQGIIRVRGKISYASQQAWIFGSSVKQNILFGHPMDKSQYDRVIEVCQLREDLSAFPHGENTIVGDRGMNLSGGQRARINLARAVYTEADIYLLDDPLSAVDTDVGKRIMMDCICDHLKGKTRILVTHQLQYLKFADQVIVMKNGSVQARGTFEELRNLEFMRTLKNEEEEENDSEEKRGSKAWKEEKNQRDKIEEETVEVTETRTTGKVSLKVFLSYLKAGFTPLTAPLVLSLFILQQMMASGSDYFIGFWVNIEEASFVSVNDTEYEFKWAGPFSREWVIYVYSFMTGAIILLCIVQTFSYFDVCMRASRNLHAGMFRSIIRAAMYFFNENPAGRILNRFSKDIGIVDVNLPLSLFDVLVLSLALLGVIGILGSVNPWLLLPTLITGFAFYYARVFYISAARSIKRLEGITRSPIFDHVSATLQGLTTVRAFKAEDILMREFDGHQDVHSSAWFLFISASRAFGLYLKIFCLIFISCVAVIFLLVNDFITVGDVGLVLTQLISISLGLQWGMRQLAEVENQLTSVERIMEYSRVDEEPALDCMPERSLPKEWPMDGRLEFKDVKLRYGPDGEHVLKGISFTIMPKEKVGIVGRTGAGKTSLISALFRLAYVEGEIKIDDIPTDSIGLHDFRSKISIIPQEPVLFSGSLRRNLDPFDEYPDDVLWRALEQVELKEISELVAGLHTLVSEGGTNFSVGQRQLLCLARAIVKNNKIMVLDEATANVDPQTDSLIQKTIRERFKDCSVLTIAHRLNTVMDSDKLLVMSDGYLVEFDHPYILLQRKGHLYEMVQQTGSVMASTLARIAEKSFQEKNKKTTV